MPAVPNTDPDKPLSLKQKETVSELALCESNEVPAAKKVDDCFMFDFISKEIESFMDGECPRNTTKNNEWAVCNFEAWHNARIK